MRLKKRLLFHFSVIMILAVFLFLSGCGTTNEIYSWGSFETQMYEHFNGLTPSIQIQIFENDRRKIEASGKPAPPGFYAHLGLLYTEIGDVENAVRYFSEEKICFPESAVFMDFLLNRYGEMNNEYQ